MSARVVNREVDVMASPAMSWPPHNPPLARIQAAVDLAEWWQGHIERNPYGAPRPPMIDPGTEPLLAFSDEERP